MSTNDTTTSQTPQWASDLLNFWFDELKPEDWFSGNPTVDTRIRDRFAALYDRLCESIPDEAFKDPRTALAAIILYDQFSRNLFRGSAKAFETDALALSIARHALDNDFEAQMTKNEKTFLYLPFEHSEVLADGERSVSLFAGLGDPMLSDYAVEHRDILARFGRYPHRNKPLERENTADEVAFLKEHKGFGQ